MLPVAGDSDQAIGPAAQLFPMSSINKAMLIGATTRASPTLPQPTSRSDAARPSCCNEKGSSERHSNCGAYSIAKPLPKMLTKVSQSLH